MKKIVYTLFIVVTLFVFGNSSFAQVDPISTDRPDLTESAYTIPFKSFQVETGVLYEENNQDGAKVKNLFIPSMLLRYGLLSNLELRI